MEELTPSENLFQIWMIYCSKNDINKFKEFIQLFITNYKHLIDIDFLHLNDGFSDEGPHITVLPDNILHVLGNHLSSCSINLQTGDDPEDLEFATSLLRCLIVISRNYDNIPLVASCEFAKNIVALASICMEKLSTGNCGNKEQLDMFFRLTVHFFECLYDPYFVWRKRLKSWTVDKSRMTFKPASLHVEVVPFFYDFCQKEHLSTDLRLRLLHMFGAIMCGTQYNALKVITPATLDVLLKMLSSSQLRGPTNEQRQEMLELKDLVLKCIICMVHVIHVSSPDQRQVEVSQVMEGYMQVLLENNMEPEDERENQMQLAMIGAINEMLACQDKNALQVILVTGGTFDAFVSLLQKTSLTGSEAQKLAMSVLRVMSSVLSGSVNAKERFSLRVGYGKFVEALKSLGQPSMSLLGAVLNLVVEGEFDPSQPQVIQNTQAAIMLLLWLPDIQSHDLQIWLSENMFILCSRGHNKINCCNDGMISAILTVLGREKQIDQKAVGYLINLLESLGTQSVMATEMKHLIGLLKLDDEEKQNPYCSRLMRAISTMARRDGKDGALHFFSLFDVNDCISVPGIRKWPGSAFSFHAWLCLDMDIDVSQHNVTDPQLYRRQLYSFVSSSGNGFEAFFTPSLALVIAVYNKKEYSTVAVTETKLNDSHWHCIDIVHTSSRRPFTHSQLNVYIDGKLQLNSQLKFPNMAEPFGPARIGCPCSKTVITTAASEQNHTQASDTKRLSSFRSLFQRSSQQSPDPDVTSIPTGTQSDVWGPAITLNAQLGSVSVFHEALYPAQIKSMFTAGPNHQTLFYDDEFSDLSDLSNKMVLYYNAKACRNGHCVDLSTNQNHGQLIGQRCVTRDIKDVINCIGGIQVLFPLLEQVNKGPLPLLNTQQPVQDLGDIRKGMEQDDWVVIPSSSYSDTKLEQNQVAGFLTMLRYMIHSQVTNQETFIRTNGAATIGALLQKVNPKFIDVNVLMSVQLLVETTAAVNQTLLQHLYQYVLFDFRIWSRSDFPVRIGHIQYLSTIIKDDRKYFKRRFGVQYILDVIRTYYSSSSESELTMEDMKTIRVSLLSLVKYYMMKDVTGDEVNSIMKLLVVTCDENMTCEILDVLMALLETRNKQDQLHLLMFEPDTAEMLYGLLVQPGKSVIYYEKIVKVLYILLKTDKVYEKSKARLRLTDAGLLGLVGLMQSCEISGPMIKRFLEQASTLDTPQSYNSLLALLQLIYYSGSDIKLETSRQILSILVTRPGAAKQFAKQLGWQESFIKLFIYQMTDTQPVNSSADDLDSSCDTVTTSLQGETTAVCDQNTEQQNGLCNTDNSHPSPRRTSIGHPKVLNLSTVAICDTTCKQTSPSSRTPVTPMYMSRAFGEISSSEEERSRSLSRSSSASVEDLTAMAQRAQDRHASISLSNSSFTLSDSAIDLNTSQDYTDSSKRPSSATTQADNIQKALDNLGIQKIYVKDSVERSEELCQNLLIILLTIMWKGVEGSDQAAWKERGQVFSWLDKVCENHKLIRSEVEVKRRLLEMMVHSCTTGIRDTAQGTVAPTENAMELIKLVHCFMCQDSDEDPEKYSERLIEDVMTMLDYLSVWSVETDGGWKEMAHLGLNLLLKYSNQPNLELCAVATAKLHTLVQTKLISSSAEASYLIGNLNTIILQAVKDNADSYSFLIPVMKALVDKAHHLLQLEMLLPSLPSTSRSPTFFDDFKNYCMSEEWTTYVQNFITPQQLHFSESTFEELETKTVTFWEECKEAMMVNMHKRNRERGESKLKFENQVMNSFNTKASSEQRRFQNISTQLRNQHYSTLRQWRATRRFLTGERGAWADKYISTVHWKLSNQENFSRMKVKMIPNMNFDPHADASLARDNLGASEADIAEQIEQLKLAKVAVVSKENIHDDSLGDEDWSVISTERSSEPQGKEKLVLSEDCELVTSIDVVKGRLEVTTTHVYFFDCSNHIKEEGGEDFKLSLSQLREIHFRRYNLRRSALEVFLVDQTNYFLNFQHKMRNRVYTRILSLRPPNLIYYGSRSPAELLRSSGLTKKWLNREISNFDYLMQLNTIAGRTYNDLSQYPVFPWILCDYISDHLDLENPEVYRDLSKPIGVVNPKCEREVREKFDHFEDPSGVIEKFHYGTHYSNAAGVMHFMLRMEPFTTLHIQLQSNRFDVADRQFHSIPATWSCLMENPNDVKELIPEFFYLPEFLVNMNDFDLGKLQLTKERINHVVLPKWAKSPEDFIYKHRKALESDHVSSHLHEWIDLIFGYKQKGPAAVEALNVFYYCTYEGAVDLDAVTDEKERKALEGMINNFGQTPCQLLKEPHPMRMTMEEVVARAMKVDKPLSVFQFLDQLKVFFVEVSAETDPLVYVSVPRNQARSIIQHGMPDTMLTLSEEGIIGTHGWLPYDKSISNYFTFDKDPALSNAKVKKKLLCPFAPGLKVDAKLFVVSHDGKLLFSGGHWDNSLQVYNIGKGRKVNHAVGHNDIVTCLALDYCGSHLMTGSGDTTCIVWQVIHQGGTSSNIDNKPLQILYGHDAEVTDVHLSVELDTAVSASKDGTVIIHTVRRGHYMRTLRPPCLMGYTLNIPYLVMDEVGHIVLYCHETFPVEPKERFSLHLYSINGHHLYTEKLTCGLGHMIVSGDYLITGDNQGQLCVREIFGLTASTVLPLHVGVHSLAVTNGNSHILAGLKDGKLIIIGVKNRSEIR